MPQNLDPRHMAELGAHRIDPFVDRYGGDAELSGDLLGSQMLAGEAQSLVLLCG